MLSVLVIDRFIEKSKTNKYLSIVKRLSTALRIEAWGGEKRERVRRGRGEKWAVRTRGRGERHGSVCGGVSVTLGLLIILTVNNRYYHNFHL